MNIGNFPKCPKNRLVKQFISTYISRIFHLCKWKGLLLIYTLLRQECTLISPSSLGHVNIAVVLKIRKLCLCELFTELWYPWGKHLAPGKNEFSLWFSCARHVQDIHRGWDTQSPMPIGKLVLFCKAMGKELTPDLLFTKYQANPHCLVYQNKLTNRHWGLGVPPPVQRRV